MAVHPASLPETEATSLPDPLDPYLEKANQIAKLRHKLEVVARIQPGELGCSECGYVGPKAEFRFGRGRSFGEHPEHRYCPACGRSVDWFGYLDGDLIAA